MSACCTVEVSGRCAIAKLAGPKHTVVETKKGGASTGGEEVGGTGTVVYTFECDGTSVRSTSRESTVKMDVFPGASAD